MASVLLMFIYIYIYILYIEGWWLRFQFTDAASTWGATLLRVPKSGHPNFCKLIKNSYSYTNILENAYNIICISI